MWTSTADGAPAGRPEPVAGIPPARLRRKRRPAARHGCALARPARPGETPACTAASCCGCPRMVDWLSAETFW